MYGRLGEHGIVLELGFTEWGTVAGDQDKLGCRWQETGEMEKMRISTRDLLSLMLQSPERELGEWTHPCRCASA